MRKEFLPYDIVRNNGFRLAQAILNGGFIPDVIYASLRGGAYLANCISEYFNIACRDKKIFYAAVVARSYTGVSEKQEISLEGWTCAPENFLDGKKVLLVDDIYDSGTTINFLVDVLLRKGIARENLKVAVHDYKTFAYKEPLPHQPDYWCRRFDIKSPDENVWIHYSSHELVGLSEAELEEQYYKNDPSLSDVLGPIFR